MTKKTIECIEDIKTLESIWNKTIEKATTNNVFLTYEWLTCWLQIYATDGNQFIICIKENDSVIALAPLIIVRHNELGVPLRRLQFIGYRSCDYIDFIIIKDKEECMELIFEYVNKNNHKWDYGEFLHLSEESDNLDYIRKTLISRNQWFKLRKDCISPFIMIQSDIETFLKHKKSGLRYDLKKGEKDLENLGKLAFSKITNQKDALNELPTFFDLLSKREELVGRQGTHQSKKELQEIFKLYIADDNMWGSINFCKLSIDNKSIAYHFGFEYNKKLYFYKPTFDIIYLRQSPGKLLIKKLIEYAYENDFDEFDFLRGDEPYKFQWTKEYRDSYALFFFSEKFFSKLLFYWFLNIRPVLRDIKNSIMILKK